MVAVFVLVAGVIFVMALGAVVLIVMGAGHILTSLVPLGPGLVMAGTFLLMLAEMLLFFGGREDRRAAMRDFGYMLPTFLISGALYYFSQLYLW